MITLEYIEEVFNLGITSTFHFSRLREKYLEKNNKKILDEIKEYSLKHNLTSFRFTEQIYLFLSKTVEKPKCKTCGGEVKFSNLFEGYRQFCGPKCSNSNSEVQLKKEKTNIEKYGCKYNTEIYLKQKGDFTFGKKDSISQNDVTSFKDYYNKVLLINGGPQINSRYLSEDKLKKVNMNLYNQFLQEIKDKKLEEFNLTFKEIFYCILHNLNREDLLCPICKINPKGYQTFTLGFRKTCVINKKCNRVLFGKNQSIFYKTEEGRKSILKSRSTYKITNIERYGVEHPSLLDTTKEKISKSNSNTYNDKQKLKEIIEKRDSTILEVYGTKRNYNLLRTEKGKKTNLKNYNETSYSKTQDFKEKVKRTNELKYGPGIISNFQLLKPMSLIEKVGLIGSKRILYKTKITNIVTLGYSSYAKTEKHKKTVSQTLGGYQRKLHYTRILNILQSKNITHSISYEEYCNKLSSGRYIFKCNCGLEFEDYLNYNGLPRCPVCTPYSENIGEKEITKYLESLQFSVISNTRKIISPLELDLYLSSQNLAIEYNGILRHSIGMSKDNMFNNFYKHDELKNYHLNKTELCDKKGIQLLHINENEWLDEEKKDIWKEHIQFKLGLLDKSFYTLDEILKRTYYIEVLQGDLLKVDRRYSNGKELLDLGYKVVDTLEPTGYKFSVNKYDTFKIYQGEELINEKERVIYDSGYLIFKKYKI